jgi:hypothetical protein
MGHGLSSRYKIQDTRFKIQDTRYKIQDSRFKIQDSRFKIQDSRFKIQDSRFKIQDSRFKIQDSRYRAPRKHRSKLCPDLSGIQDSGFSGYGMCICFPVLFDVRRRMLDAGYGRFRIQGIVECAYSVLCDSVWREAKDAGYRD